MFNSARFATNPCTKRMYQGVPLYQAGTPCFLVARVGFDSSIAKSIVGNRAESSHSEEVKDDDRSQKGPEMGGVGPTFGPKVPAPAVTLEVLRTKLDAAIVAEAYRSRKPRSVLA
jgi:hypothetical protein